MLTRPAPKASTQVGDGGAFGYAGAPGSTPVLLPGLEASSNDQAATPDLGKECVSLRVGATRQLKPVDVVFVVDNSSSMDDEITAIQERIHSDFAKKIGSSGLDYRVILISRYGKVGVAVGASDNPICIGPPLGTSDCQDPARTQLTNGERFKHFSADVESHDALCNLIGGFAQPDEYGDWARRGWKELAPQGYSQYLRSAAFKHLVVITDDDVSCRISGLTLDDQGTSAGGEATAAAFDRALLKLSPLHFGDAEARNYAFHSIVGLSAKTEPTHAHSASDPIVTRTCGKGSAGPGTGYQALSRLTSGLRYPSCNASNFDALFDELATGVVERAKLACSFAVPSPPDGQVFDPSRVNVQFSMSDAKPEPILHVSGLSACEGGEGWAYDDDPTRPRSIELCPATCARIEDRLNGPNLEGQVDLLFGCVTREAPR